MRFDKFTTKRQEALAEAQRLAERAGHPEVGTEHVLQALLDQKGGAVLPVLEAARVPVDRIRRALEQRFQSLPKFSPRASPRCSSTPRSRPNGSATSM
jgi:ATP-dependent Clp protease ATP-binding subunit ClpB